MLGADDAAEERDGEARVMLPTKVSMEGRVIDMPIELYTLGDTVMYEVRVEGRIAEQLFMVLNIVIRSARHICGKWSSRTPNVTTNDRTLTGANRLGAMSSLNCKQSFNVKDRVNGLKRDTKE